MRDARLRTQRIPPTPTPAPDMTKIALLRHFPTAWNEAGRLQGRADIPLSPEGRAALAGLRLPPRWRGAPLISSPLARARETAETLAEGAPVRLDPRLMEMDLGAWEGAASADLLADPASGYRPVETWTLAFRAPGGEGPEDLFARLRPLLAELSAPTILVAHRGILRAILALATGWRYEGREPFRIKRFALHPVTLRDGAPAGIAPPEKLVPL